MFPAVKTLWKDTVSAEFWANRPKLCGNCAFSQNFLTSTLGEIAVFYAVWIYQKNQSEALSILSGIIYLVRSQNFPKNQYIFLTPPPPFPWYVQVRVCITIRGLRNVSFPENFASGLNKRDLFTISYTE